MSRCATCNGIENRTYPPDQRCRCKPSVPANDPKRDREGEMCEAAYRCVSAPTPLPAPGAVIAQIDADAQALDTASKSLYRAIKNKAEAEQEYEKELRTQLITIFDDYKQRGERMPAEDLRKALAHKQIPHKVYADYIVAVAEVEAMTARTRAITAAMNGRQSLLAALRDELRAAA